MFHRDLKLFIKDMWYNCYKLEGCLGQESYCIETYNVKLEINGSNRDSFLNDEHDKMLWEIMAFYLISINQNQTRWFVESL